MIISNRNFFSSTNFAAFFSLHSRAEYQNHPDAGPQPRAAAPECQTDRAGESVPLSVRSPTRRIESGEGRLSQTAGRCVVENSHRDVGKCALLGLLFTFSGCFVTGRGILIWQPEGHFWLFHDCQSDIFGCFVTAKRRFLCVLWQPFFNTRYSTTQ